MAKQDRNPAGKIPSPVALSLVYEASVPKEFLNSRPPVLAYASVSSSPWQMPHVSDISNILGACVISISITLRKIHINSYSGSNSLHTHSQWTSALLSHNSTSIYCGLGF